MADNTDGMPTVEPLDDEIVRRLEKLEGIVAHGKLRFVLLRGVVPSALVAIALTAWLWFQRNPYWYLGLVFLPFYVALGAMGALTRWRDLLRRIERLQSGQSDQMPRDAREGNWLAVAGVFLQTTPVFFTALGFVPTSANDSLSPTVIALSTMALIAGTIIAFWGVLKLTLAVRRMPREQRTLRLGWVAALAMWFGAIMSTATVTVVLSDVAFAWLPFPFHMKTRQQLLLESNQLKRKIDKEIERADRIIKELEEKAAAKTASPKSGQ